MSDELPREVREKLQAVRDRFALQLPARLAALHEKAALFAHAPERALLVELHQGLHALSGTCGTFGFVRLGQAAYRIEQLAKAALDAPDVLSSDCVNELAAEVLGFARADAWLGGGERVCDPRPGVTPGGAA